MVNLRKQLRAYYSAEGSKDNIEISFPVRSGFPPRFGYRKLTDPVQSVQRLADDFRYTFPDMEQCGRIVVELEACVAKHPSYAAGHAVLAEALLACLMCDAISVFPLPKALLRAEQAVNTGLMLNDEIWRLHVVAGAIHCCRFDWGKADAAYKTALHLSRHDTISHFWYVAFLLAVGKRDEAERCLDEAQRIDCGREKPWVRIAPFAWPLFHYINRNVVKSYLCLPMALTLSKDFENEFPPQYRWLGEALITCLHLEGMSPEMPQHTIAENCVRTETWLPQSKVGAFEGLIVLMRMRTAEWGKRQEDRDTPLSTPIEPELHAGSPLSFALAYMATARPEEAIAQLEKACEIGYPLMFWLHLLPIFDPLRDHPKFKALIKRLNLP
jgi:hypothetical protein